MGKSKKGSLPNRLLLTERALRDIRGIKGFSAERWGERVAEKYVDETEAALDRILEQPGLLQEAPGFSKHLRFYRVEKHVLVCDLQDSTIYVLTVLHTSMDIPKRLAKLQPQLALEVDLLRKRVAAMRKQD